ncbi:m-AAA protease-interacting protein 1, mitochondrial-like [Plodia interpunctella]|uniref:m-AAA protease-interacting protein 1, mitochondrial-like n=1 Tax=Plodia interpunctella TaxID=58824 RepID=UPI0023686C53|nr:m-AAA protease-interacting protein 1, mitochondrial-like [Plodia interpunctella]
MASVIRILGKRYWPAQIETLAKCRSCGPGLNKNTPLLSITPGLTKSSLISFNQPWIEFRQLEPHRNLHNGDKLLQPSTKQSNDFLNGFPKTFFFKRKKDPNKKRVPKLILVQNPFTWLMIKIDFCVLRHVWDPSFQEKEFKFGAKQAISRVTDVISKGQYAELNGLLTKAARLSLLRELERNWSDRQRSLLSLNRNDIQISSPRKVYFIRIADKKYCDVDMAFLALKWVPINTIDALIFTEIFARFHREYTPHCIPEWTIAYFKVTRFEVLRQKT